MSLYWMSFCDPTKPKGERFLGACIGEGDDPRDLIENAWRNKCNPGGEVAFAPIPASAPHNGLPKWTMWSSMEEVNAALATIGDKGIRTVDMPERAQACIQSACPDCNKEPQ